MNYTRNPIAPGRYWWLPNYLGWGPELDANWSIVCVHLADENRQKSGLFYGPLKSPASNFDRSTGHNAHDRAAAELIKQTIEAI